MPLRKKIKKSKVQNVTPKVYNGVQYKSTLEAYCARKLTEVGLPVNYEHVKFPILDKFTCPSTSIEFKIKKNKAVPLTQNVFEETSCNIRGMVYTPDFTSLEGNFKWVIEVKGIRDAAYLVRFKLFRHYLFRNNLCYQLYVPNNKEQVDQVIAHILANSRTS